MFEIDELSESQKVVLLALSLERASLPGETAFQKLLFVLSWIIPEVKNELDYGPDFFGPFSENAREQLNELVQEGLLYVKNREIGITPAGLSLAKKAEAQTSAEDKNKIIETKLFLNDLSNDELLTVIYVTYPEYTTESLVLEKALKRRKSVALNLYLRGKVTESRGAEIAGLSLEDFLRLVKEQ
jgi:uncharacterized protein YwgA